MHYKAHILHRDVSDGNIMYTKHDGADWFVLIDFDLAAKVDTQGMPLGATSRHCTGTLLYMDPTLLYDLAEMAKAHGQGQQHAAQTALPHCVRFDFVSLFFVVLCIMIMGVGLEKDTADPNDLSYRKSTIQLMEAGDYWSMAAVKAAYLTRWESLRDLSLSPTFAHLRGWLLAFSFPLSRDMQRRNEWIRDQDLQVVFGKMREPAAETFQQIEMLHGEVTAQKILDSLNTYGEKK